MTADAWTCPDCGRRFARTGQPITRQIGFRGTNRIFAAARLVGPRLQGYLDLPHDRPHPTVHHVASFSQSLWVHHFRVGSPAEMDRTFAAAVCEAHVVGDGRR